MHFNGVMEKVCKAGIKYEDVRVEPEGSTYQFPCREQAEKPDVKRYYSKPYHKPKMLALML